MTSKVNVLLQEESSLFYFARSESSYLETKHRDFFALCFALPENTWLGPGLLRRLFPREVCQNKTSKEPELSSFYRVLVY